MRPRRAALLQPRVAKQAKWEGKTTLRQSCGCAVFLKEYARYAPHLASFAFNCSHHARGNVTGWDYGTSCQSNLEPTWTNTFTLRRTKARWGALCYQVAYAPKQLRGFVIEREGGSPADVVPELPHRGGRGAAHLRRAAENPGARAGPCTLNPEPWILYPKRETL